MNYEFTAKSIIFQIGGKKNIKSLTHCITRLRFVVDNKSKVNMKGLEDIEGVLTVIDSGGQIQVVIGSEVDDVYEAVVKNAKLEDENISSETGYEVKKKPLDAFIDLISGIFQPIIRVLAAAGIIKGLLIIAVFSGLLTKNSGFYIVLFSAADVVFYYLPILVGVSAAKKFKINPYLGLVIGGSLVHPSIVAITKGEVLFQVFTGTILQSNVFTTFLGIPVILMNYSSSVVPALFAIFFASKVDKFARKHLNKNIKEVFAPAITLCITVPFTLLLIGPVATYLSNFISYGLNVAYNAYPPLAGFILGGLWQVLVMFGLHWGVIPLFINEIMTTGSSGIFALITATPLATAGVVLAIYLKTKNKDLKSLAFPAMISSFCGVSEPSLYGITLPRKKPFFITLFSAAIGGLIIGLFKGRMYLIGAGGVFSIASAINPETGPNNMLYGYIFALLVALVLGFTLTWMFGFDDKTDPILNKERKTIKEVTEIYSPMQGTIVELNTLEDKAFSKGIIGDGLAINPTDGKVYAPFSGTLSVVFPTGHAFGITGDDGLEMLIHIGIDTVKLDGKGFKTFFKQGDAVKQGDLIAEFNIEEIKAQGYSLISPVIITNGLKNRTIVKTNENSINYQDSFIQLI
jgi:PTS system beta-glucosides-specific IIC component